jgi:hypothetical protein
MAPRRNQQAQIRKIKDQQRRRTSGTLKLSWVECYPDEKDGLQRNYSSEDQRESQK